MAARTQAPRGRAGTARRRPARRAAPRRHGTRIHWDRVGRIALTVVLVAVLYSYLNPVINFVKTYTATSAAKAKEHVLQHENTRLHHLIQTSGDPTVIAAEARAQGMVAEGETPIVLAGLPR